MWKWIKNFINNIINEKERKSQKDKLDFSKMTKGDLKKLYAKGIIKDIYNPDK